MTGAVNAEDALEPGDDFVRGWVGWLIEVDDSRRDVRLEIALEWCAARGDWGEVAGANEDWRGQGRLEYCDWSRALGGYLTLVPVLEQQRPVAGVDAGRNVLGLYHLLLFLLDLLLLNEGGHCGAVWI